MNYSEEAHTHLTFLWGIHAALKSENMEKTLYELAKILRIADSDVNYWNQKAIKLGYKEEVIE